MRCHRCSSRTGSVARHRQKGAALIVAMLVFALATALVVAMKSEFDRFFQRSVNLLFDEQAQAYLRGAEDLSAMVLIMDYDEDKSEGVTRDDMQEIWWVDPEDPPAPFPLDDIGWMTGALEDLQGRFNLNALAKRAPDADKPGATTVRTVEQEQFIRLLQALGEPAVSQQEAIAITESVSDWLDPDTNPSANGAEDDYYYGRTPSYRTANRAMTSVSELRAVANVTPEIYQALLPWVTVWPQTPGKLNIHTAPAMVLRSINAPGDLSPLSVSEGDSLAEYRKETGFKDKNDFLANPVFAGKAENMSNIKALLGESSSYFLLRAEAEVAGRNVHLYSVLHRHNRQIDSLIRASGSL